MTSVRLFESVQSRPGTGISRKRWINVPPTQGTLPSTSLPRNVSDCHTTLPSMMLSRNPSVDSSPAALAFDVCAFFQFVPRHDAYILRTQ